MADRYVCVHGHFYQPPRENPWLERVERQESAWPFHDWNERITEECYAPNTSARVLDEEGRLDRLVDNYARLSFNMGPTLLAWMEEAAPETYRRIIDADRVSQERSGGHGSALAQAYNHVILPLASPRDRRTQVLWGIADFRHRFGREPEGMWLAECAADVETLDVLAEHGIAFTILSPYQAGRVRLAELGSWQDVSGGKVDPTRPYRVALPSGREITVFFYDGPISQAVAFEGLLASGHTFARRILSGFSDREGPQLVNLATDGESYGHHHRHGEMALAHALELLDDDPDVELTTYGRYLELHPAVDEAEIVDPSSWSCAHGIERWRSDCGCTTGGEPGWNQAWRAPLRDALDGVRDELAERFERAAGELVEDPWAARDDHVQVVLDRRPASIDRFLDAHARRPLSDDEESRVLALLEMQRHAMLMYTSCGWFFEELSRIETVQVLHYAARAIQLARAHLGVDLEEGFLTRLAEAPSNLAMYADGRAVYEHLVAPAVADLERVAAHFAITGLFRHYHQDDLAEAYEVDRERSRVDRAGRARLGYGRVRVRSRLTLETEVHEYAVLHLGDHNFTCGLRPVGEDTAFEELVSELQAGFASADFPTVLRAIDRHFDHGHRYSLRDLFKDAQGRLLRQVLDATMRDVEASYRDIYRGRAPLMRFLSDLRTTIPGPLRDAAQVVVNAELRDIFLEGVDPDRIRGLIEEARLLDLELDTEALARAIDDAIRRTAQEVAQQLEDPSLFATFGDRERAFFGRISELVAVAGELPFEVDLGRAQHVCYRAVRDHRAALLDRSAGGDGEASAWLTHLDRLAAELRVSLPG